MTGNTYNRNDYEEIHIISERKTAKQEAKKWKNRKIKTYNQYAYFRNGVGKDYEATYEFLTSWLPKVWTIRHRDEELREYPIIRSNC